MWIVQLSLRNALRNTRRTGLTALTILLGTALLTVGVSWVGGVMGSMLSTVTALLGEVRVVTPGYAEREALNPLYENLADTGPLVQALRDEGLQAWPVLRLGAVVSADEEVGEDFALVMAAEPGYYADVLKLDQSVVAGTYPAALAQDECLIGRRVAEDLGVQPGAELLLLGQTQDGSMSPILARVVAVISAGDALTDRQVFIDLERGRYMADIPAGALEVLVFGDGSIEDAGALAQRVRELPVAQGLTVQAWLERSPYNELLPLVDVILGILVGSIVFIAALGVLNTMLMSVLERTAEIGVMRALGLGGPAAVLMFVIEAAGIGLAGAVPGAALGGLAAVYLERHGFDLGDRVTKDVAMPFKTTLYADFTPSVALLAVLLGVVMAVLGALLPSARAAGIQPVDAMRSRR